MFCYLKLSDLVLHVVPDVPGTLLGHGRDLFSDAALAIR